MALSTRLRCLLNLQRKTNAFVFLQCRFLNSEDFTEEEKKVKKHVEDPRFPDEYSIDGPPKGKSYDKKPFRMELVAGKKYHWCACGHSKSQPLCDGSHKQLWGSGEKKTMPKYRSLPFFVDETKEYWLCNCKQTSKRPFCDGTHKREDIQSLRV